MLRSKGMFTASRSMLTASMLRDVERGAATEVEQVLGDLLQRGGDPSLYPRLRIAYAHLRTYEVRRIRMQAAA